MNFTAIGAVLVAPVGRCLYRAERGYGREEGIGHDVLDLYATGHATTGPPIDEWNWPHGLDLWDWSTSTNRGR